MRAKWLIAVLVVGVGFGGGVFYGRSTRKNVTRLPDGSAVDGISAADIEEALAQCRSESKVQAKPSVFVPIEVGDAGLAESAKFEVLQKEVHECRVRETLQNAYVCGTIGDNINLLDVLMFGNSCKDEAKVLEFMVESLARCAEFDELPEHLDEAQLTREDKSRLAESEMNRRFRDKNNITGWGQTIGRKCRKLWALSED